MWRFSISELLAPACLLRRVTKASDCEAIWILSGGSWWPLDLFAHSHHTNLRLTDAAADAIECSFHLVLSAALELDRLISSVQPAAVVTKLHSHRRFMFERHRHTHTPWWGGKCLLLTNFVSTHTRARTHIRMEIQLFYTAWLTVSLRLQSPCAARTKKWILSDFCPHHERGDTGSLKWLIFIILQHTF